jgi:hypothetical protein
MHTHSSYRHIVAYLRRIYTHIYFNKYACIHTAPTLIRVSVCICSAVYTDAFLNASITR